MARDSRSGTYAEATPELSEGVYLRGMQIGPVQELPRGNHKAGLILQSLTVIDLASFTPGLDVYLFDSLPAFASQDRQPFDLNDSEMRKCAGVVSVLKSEYVSSQSNSVVSRTNIGLGIKVGGQTLYAVAVARNDFAVAADDVSSLTFRYHFELERV